MLRAELQGAACPEAGATERSRSSDCIVTFPPCQSGLSISTTSGLAGGWVSVCVCLYGRKDGLVDKKIFGW